RALIDEAAGPFRLGDHEAPILGDLGDRKADRLGAWYVLEAWVGEVTPADLRAAFEQMADESAGSDAIEIVPIPAKMRDQRAERQRRIGDAAGDHDLRSGFDRVGDRSRADISVGGD